MSTQVTPDLLADYDLIQRWNGHYVGILNESEREAFNRLVKAGWAQRSYAHAAGGLGIAKVKLL